MNQADLIPAREYSYTAACEGTLVKEGNQPVCVRAEASVNIFFGDGKTEAWKEIRGSFNGTEGTGTGTDSSRNSIIADAGSEVTYTLNIRNQVEKGIENLVIVDLSLIHICICGERYECARKNSTGSGLSGRW